MPASFLKIGGELVQDAILQLVEVTQELNQHWWCRVECRQTEDKRIPVENLLGQDIQIVTHDQAGAEHVVFDGFVLEASLLYEVFGSYTARLKAVTRSYKLDLTAQEAYYRKKTLSDVAQSLASADGLSADVRCADGTKRNYVQWGDPDFRFLVRIADDHQAWIRPTAQGIQICDAFQRGAQVIWRQEDGLLSFDVEGALAPPAFDGTHSDARQMRSSTHTAVSKAAEHFGSSNSMVAAVGKQSKARLPSAAAFLDSRAATADEYKALLERESLRAAGNRVVAHGISRKEDLKAGDTVEIEGVLDGKGTYGLTKVIHRWTAQGYENEFWCTPWKNYVSPRAPEPSEIAGVVTARVVEHNDPRKMGRVQVQYDWQENGPTGWVRATTPHAGQDRGFLFMPEIGDEVVVAFEHGDPERPYLVGCLWNGVDQAPRAEFWGEDVEPNDVKRIVTKSGHRIQFVDKPGKESIVIATPQHLKISLIEKTDETGRSMILLHSDGDIFINAPGGRVHLRSASLSQDVGATGQSRANASGPPPSNASAPSHQTLPRSSHTPAVLPRKPGEHGEGKVPPVGRGKVNPPQVYPVLGSPLPSVAPKEPGAAPKTIQLPEEVNKKAAELWKNSFPGGKSQEQGGLLVRDQNDGVSVINEAAGDQGSATINRTLPTGYSSIGAIHTHPYDQSEGGHTDVSLSGGDAAYAINNGDNSIIAQSGKTQFMYLRTGKTPKHVDFGKLDTEQNTRISMLIRTNGMTFPEASRAAAKETAKRYELAYYEGENGLLNRVHP